MLVTTGRPALLSLMVFSLLLSSSRGEWLSDIGASSPQSNQKALATRSEKFWEAVRKAAEEVNLSEHEDLLESVEGVLGALPKESAPVAALLRSAAERLRRASQAVFLNAISAGETAGEQLERGFLAARPANSAVGLSALGDVFGHAIRRFKAVEGGAYGEEALREVGDRQAAVLPFLRQSAELSKDVLTDCRMASKEAFDALKYELYVPGAPKTPQAAEDLAWKLVKAAKGIRQRFTGFVVDSVHNIAEDEATKADAPSKVLIKAGEDAAVAAAPLVGGAPLALPGQEPVPVPGQEPSAQSSARASQESVVSI